MDSVIINDYESLLERFSIMTTDGNVDVQTALSYCYNNTTPELAKRLKAALKHDYLRLYLKLGISLIPSKNKMPLVKYSINPEKMITEQFMLEHWIEQGVTEYGFIPSKHNLLILDLDKGETHANKADGIANFTSMVQSVVLNDKFKSFFEDFPQKYPCYTITPSGGIHLYFRASYITPELAKRLDYSKSGSNIELKYNTKVTAAGSLIGGREYVLFGSFENIPNMTLDFLELLTKQKTIKRQQYRRLFENKNRKKWNETPIGIISKATELYSSFSNHDFIYKTAVLFKNAGFDNEVAERFIMQTPQHLQRKNQADTHTAIKSIYKGLM